VARHAPVEFLNEDKRECRICGRELVGFGKDLRHAGEAIRVVTPDPADADVFARAIQVGEAALDRFLPSEATDADRARLVVEAIYQDGLLRRRRATVDSKR
jgi:hypothetical protein